MIYSSSNIEQNILKLVILGQFLPFYSPKNPKNQNFEKWKKLLEVLSFYICAPKIAIIWFTVPKIRSETQNFLSLWAILCPFTSPVMILNINILKKSKKYLEILSFYTYMRTINEDHMMYGSWNIRCDRHKFLTFWATFYPFSPWKPGKSKFQHWKKHLEILWFYTFAS